MIDKRLDKLTNEWGTNQPINKQAMNKTFSFLQESVGVVETVAYYMSGMVSAKRAALISVTNCVLITATSAPEHGKRTTSIE